MPIVSKTVEVSCDETTILSIVADFEAYPQWNEEVKGCWILHRYDDGRPSQLRLDTEIQGNQGTFIQAVYYPEPNQIQTVMQQGELFTKQHQLFSVVGMGTHVPVLERQCAPHLYRLRAALVRLCKVVRFFGVLCGATGTMKRL